MLTGDGELRRSKPADGNIYHLPTVFQLKAIYYHTGIMTERSTEPSNLDPEADEYALRDLLV